MCGIWLSAINNYNKFLSIKHRGPDYSFYKEIYKNLFLGFHRLAIIDNNHLNNQPFIFQEKNRTVYLICNGEIYNYKELSKEFKLKTKSDCEVVLHLYLKYGIDYTCKILDAEFAFIIIDINNKTNKVKIIAARDPIGVRPLFYNNTSFSSELKGLIGKSYIFPPGSYMINSDSNIINSQITKYYSYNFNKKHICNKDKLITIFTNAVKKRLIHDDNVEIGALLSGGLDSSIVSAIAAKYIPNIKTFTISFANGTDKYYAELVANHIKSNHTTFIVTPEEVLELLEDVIYTIESYDITTVRASCMQYILSQKIRENNPNLKVLLVGELSDELQAGYKYFHYNKKPIDIFNECIRLVKDVHKYDGLRTDRTTSNFGLEVRIPFADLEFVKYILTHQPDQLMPRDGIEKYLFRKTFDKTNILPKEVLWREKDAFSNSVSSTEKDWKEYIQEYIKEKYNMTEAEYYKSIFIKYFGKENLHVIPYIWMPKWTNATDPSAKTWK